MIFNFRKASLGQDELQTRIAAIDTDLRREEFPRNPELQGKVATLMHEVVTEMVAATDVLPMLSERREGALGNTYELRKVVNTARVVQAVPGQEPLVFTPRKARLPLKSARYEMAWGIELEKLANGTYTVEEVLNQGAEGILRHMNGLAVAAVAAAAQAQGTDAQGRPLVDLVGSADLDKQSLDAAIRRLGPGCRIFGSSWALDPIMEFAADTDASKDELRQRGVIGRYRGCDLVQINDKFNPFAGEYTQVEGRDLGKYVIVAGPEAGAIFLDVELGGLAGYEEYNARRAFFEVGTRFEHGVTVHTPSSFHVFILD
jgi:hypothetical protein